jgi:hypothetical protein
MEGNFRRSTEPNRADRLDGPVWVAGWQQQQTKNVIQPETAPGLVVHLDSVLDFLGILRNVRRDAGSGVDLPSRVQKAFPI